jgi:hypothetical protein
MNLGVVSMEGEIPLLKASAMEMWVKPERS